MLNNHLLERSVLAGICQHGKDVFYDVEPLINENTFTLPANAVLFKCLRHIVHSDDEAQIDVPSIMAASAAIGLPNFFAKTTELEHLRSILRFPVEKNNVRRFAVQIKKLEIARAIYDRLGIVRDRYTGITGEESISEILGIAENAIFDLAGLIHEDKDEPELLLGDADQYLTQRAENPVDQLGIPTGFDRFDHAIGGGLRTGVTVVGARIKTGKTIFGLNVAHNVASRGIPVLFMDTEMTKEEQLSRSIASLTYKTSAHSTIDEIETGQFGINEERKIHVIDYINRFKDLPVYHMNISGRAFEEQISIMRRWVAQTVGLDYRRRTHDCVIVYDYLKLMDTSDLANKNLAEFQVLGFRMTALHNFSVKYRVPILLFIQLNRDGITKETTDVASGSDRILWLCTSFSIYKYKSDNEIAQDGVENGNRKLVPLVSRHGPGLAPGDYINIIMVGSSAKLIEGKTAHEIAATRSDGDDDDDDVDF